MSAKKPLRYVEVCVDEVEHEWCDMPVYSPADTIHDLMVRLAALRKGFDYTKLTIATQENIGVN